MANAKVTYISICFDLQYCKNFFNIPWQFQKSSKIFEDFCNYLYCFTFLNKANCYIQLTSMNGWAYSFSLVT